MITSSLIRERKREEGMKGEREKQRVRKTERERERKEARKIF